jgi:hypothetical protein
MPHETGPPQTRRPELAPLLNQLGPSFYALAVGTLYVSGFLVLNSNLAKSGVLDIEFIDARYFLSGASFVFFLVCFYLFAGRAVLFAPKWLGEDLQRVNKNTPRPFWSFVVFIHSFVTATFFCCLSAALFTSFAIGSAESAFFYAALAGAFLILYTFDVTNLDVRFPRFSETVTIAAKLIAIYTFFAHLGSGAMLIAFISYVSIFVFINLVLDGFSRYKLTTDRVTFSGIYAVVFVLATAIGYGTSLYGQVSSKLGGARPQTVSLGLTNEARHVLPSPFAASASQVLDGELIHQTPTYTYVVSAGHTLRLRTSDVLALVVMPEPERNFWKEYVKRVSESSPNPSLKGTAAGKPAAAP